MNLTTTQRYALLEKFACYITQICDKCGKGLGPVRFTRRGESGVWCSRECRGDAEKATVRKGGRPRKHCSNAEKQRAYRGRILGVTKPSSSFAETKDLQVQKTPLSHCPLAEAFGGLRA
jgi:hypothetical protein